MIGLVLLATSWLLLRLEGRSLVDLGFDRPRRRASELAVGLLLAGAFVALQQLLSARVAGFVWERNHDLTWGVALDGLRFTVNSVLYEEFVFRGYLLVQALRFLGPRAGVGLSAVAFGVYHGFSYGVLSNPVVMAFVFVLTGVAGLMFAESFRRTGSLALPVGLHLGWNLVNIGLFSRGPIVALVLVPVPADGPDRLGTGASLLLNLALPLAFAAVVLWKLPSPPRGAALATDVER